MPLDEDRRISNLSIRVVGEYLRIASNLGLPVMRIGYLWVIFGGAIAGWWVVIYR